MTARLVGANVVISAHMFNPSIISQYWLIRNNIIAENDFGPGCMFSEVLANIQAKEFNLTVLPDVLQFVPIVDEEREQQLVVDKVGGIVDRLPHTPYRAIGLNYIWHLSPGGRDAGSFTRRFFFSENRKIDKCFDTADARFGGYFSKDSLGARLKLDIKPITIRFPDLSREMLQFSFNYHLDLADTDAITRIQGLLANWANAKREASEIMASASGDNDDH